MPPKSTARKSTNAAKVGPVKPGTPLYQALEMIAREVAKDLESGSTRERKRPEVPNRSNS